MAARTRSGTTRVVLIAAAVVAGVVGVGYLIGGDARDEADRLGALLRLAPGDTIAEIGAGSGWLSVEMAARVTPRGRVFATELDAQRRDTIRESVADAGLANVTVVEAGIRDTNLDAGCCDAVFMRRVYHHLDDPTGINQSLYAAIKPGGRLVIIEFRSDGWFARIIGEGILPDALVGEVTAAGFTHVGTDDWPGSSHYVTVFERPT